MNPESPNQPNAAKPAIPSLLHSEYRWRGVGEPERLGGLNGFGSGWVKATIQNMKRYLLLLAVMLAVNWVLGALQAAHIIPLWSFLVINFPFGVPFVWLESHWAVTGYSPGEGQSLSESWSFVALIFSVFAQAWLYSVLLGWWGSRRVAATA